MRVIDFFSQHPFDSLTKREQPELMRSLLRPILDASENGLLIYRERKILLARLIDSETNDQGYGGQAEPVGFLDESHPETRWPNPWRFFNTWDNCRLMGSWISAPYVGFDLLIDPDMIHLAEKCLADGNSEPFVLAQYFLEQEWERLVKEHRKKQELPGMIQGTRLPAMALPGDLRQTYIRTLMFAEKRFALDIDGIHGRSHWLHVVKNGFLIAKESELALDRQVILLFGLLHDVERKDNGLDPEHGKRSADLVATLQGKLFNLPPAQLTLLTEACRGHNGNEWHPDPTVQACWDADRLDLTRLGKKVDPVRLLTTIGKHRANIMLLER